MSTNVELRGKYPEYELFFTDSRDKHLFTFPINVYNNHLSIDKFLMYCENENSTMFIADINNVFSDKKSPTCQITALDGVITFKRKTAYFKFMERKQKLIPVLKQIIEHMYEKNDYELNSDGEIEPIDKTKKDEIMGTSLDSMMVGAATGFVICAYMLVVIIGWSTKIST